MDSSTNQKFEDENATVMSAKIHNKALIDDEQRSEPKRDYGRLFIFWFDTL